MTAPTGDARFTIPVYIKAMAAPPGEQQNALDVRVRDDYREGVFVIDPEDLLLADDAKLLLDEAKRRVAEAGVERKCQCKCGCQTMMRFPDAAGHPELCSVCGLRFDRDGDEEHGLPECGCEAERCFGPMSGYSCRAANKAEAQSPAPLSEYKGRCNYCKKPVYCKTGEAWHTKGDDVWHEICSYQQQIEALKAQLAAAPAKGLVSGAGQVQRDDVELLWAAFKRCALKIADDVYYDRLTCTLEEAFKDMSIPPEALPARASQTSKGKYLMETETIACKECGARYHHTAAQCIENLKRQCDELRAALEDARSPIQENYNDSREDVDRFNRKTGGGHW